MFGIPFGYILPTVESTSKAFRILSSLSNAKPANTCVFAGCVCGDERIRTLHVRYRLSIFLLLPVAKYLTNLFESYVTVPRTVTLVSAYTKITPKGFFCIGGDERIRTSGGVNPTSLARKHDRPL
jgi:hypothetical protein